MKGSDVRRSGRRQKGVDVGGWARLGNCLIPLFSVNYYNCEVPFLVNNPSPIDKLFLNLIA